jgi:hypothetical protein
VTSFPLSLRFPVPAPIIAWHSTSASRSPRRLRPTSTHTRPVAYLPPHLDITAFLLQRWPPRSKRSMRRFAQTSTRTTFARPVCFTREGGAWGGRNTWNVGTEGYEEHTANGIPDFWGPASNFGIPIAAIADMSKDPEMYVPPPNPYVTHYRSFLLRITLFSRGRLTNTPTVSQAA